MTNRTKGTLFCLICVALWALIPVVAKLGQSELDSHQFLFWSSLVSFSVIFGSALATGKIGQFRQLRAADWLWFAFLGLLGTYIYYLFLYLGYAKATGMEVLVIQYTWPILIVIFSLFLLGEKLNLKKSLAVVLGFLGVTLVLTRGNIDQVHIDNPLVIALVGAGAACFALFSVLSKKLTQEPLILVSIYFLVASLASLISMFSLSEFAFPSSSEWFPVLLNGVLVNGFSYVFWAMALRLTEASYLAPFTFIAPVLSAIYLIVFFNEPFIAAYALGLLLVVGGGLINSLDSGTGTPS